jgi:hypothetical protein
MSTNLVSMEISQEQSDEIDRLLGELDARLGTLPVLSIAERVRLVKMGRKNVDFVERGYRHAEINPAYLTGKLPFEEFKKDVVLGKWMRKVEEKLDMISRKVKDTAILAEAESYQSSRLYYNAVKAAAKAGDEVAEKIARDMSIHYRKSTHSQDETSTEKSSQT